MAEQPMTKTEVRQFLKRCREACAWAEQALRDNDPQELLEAVMDACGAAGHIESALTPNEWNGTEYVAQGVRGMVTA